MAYSGKGKEKQDWWIKLQDEMALLADLKKLRFQFECSSKLKDSVLAEFTKNLTHLQGGQKGTPWAGYYANYHGMKVAVAIAYSIWCKIKFAPGNQFHTIRVT